MHHSIEHIIGFHCAPAIRGIKVSNLVSIPHELDNDFQRVITEYNREFNSFGLYFYPLCRCKARRLLLVFRKERLRAYCFQKKVRQFLYSYGYYDGMTLDDMLGHLRKRMEECTDFPHEIGIFLGYPLVDVQHFIARKGSAYQVCGEWKCYVDVVDAKRTFLCYKVCRQYCQQQLEQGNTFHSLVAKTA